MVRVNPQGDPDGPLSRRARASRFPLRTLVLMLLALASFGWMWWRTHEQAKGATLRARPVIIDVEPVTGAHP